MLTASRMRRASVQGILSVLVLASTLFGCSRPKDGATLVAPPPAASVAVVESAPSSKGAGLPRDSEENVAPKEGQVAFTGMVRPTKGGYEVRGVIFDDEVLKKALGTSLDGIPSDREWFLGAKVRVTATLTAVNQPAKAYKKGDVVEQRRSGSWFEVKQLDSVELLKGAETLEGTLARSKGFFALKAHLVTQDDLGWSIPGGAKEGDRVRLHGQTRLVVCEPNAQCLVEGSLPLFDVGRGERLP